MLVKKNSLLFNDWLHTHGLDPLLLRNDCVLESVEALNFTQLLTFGRDVCSEPIQRYEALGDCKQSSSTAKRDGNFI